MGHADSQPISGRNRKVFADNYALSEARAQAVADYLATSLNVPAARVHVEGRGSDQPLNDGKDAASLAANRRVEIVIEGARFEANAPLELVEGRRRGRRHRRRRAWSCAVRRRRRQRQPRTTAMADKLGTRVSSSTSRR